jgi:hypothetical protein
VDPEQVHDFCFIYKKKVKTPSQTYFKHCVYGLRFLLKSEGVTYECIYLPDKTRKKENFPVVLVKPSQTMLRPAQTQNPYQFTLWLWCVAWEARSAKLGSIGNNSKSEKA